MAVEAGIDALNAVTPGLPRVYADQLVVGGEYSARRIRNVASKYGDAYVLESDQFQMFLPKRYNQVTIEEYVEDRWFSLVEKGQLPDGRMIPVFKFFTRKPSDKPRNAAINPRPEKQPNGIVRQFFNNFENNNAAGCHQRARSSPPQLTILLGNDATNPLMKLIIPCVSTSPK